MCFDTQELWGAGAGPTVSVSVDAFEPYLTAPRSRGDVMAVDGSVLLDVVVGAALLLVGMAIGASAVMVKLRRVQRRDRRPARLDDMRSLPAAVARGGLELARVAVEASVEELTTALRESLHGSLRGLASWALRERPDLRRSMAPDGTVTLMFSDVEGSTALNERLGDERWLEVLRSHDAVVRARVRAQRGRVVKTQGDGFMVAFVSPRAALECAVDLQRALATRPPVTGEVIHVRIGLHTGEVIHEGRDFFGRNVALAARVAAEALGGEILVSSAFRERVEESVDVRFGQPHRAELKGLKGTWDLYPILWAA